MIDDLIKAAEEGSTEQIEQFLQAEPELLHAIKETGETPMMAAIYHGKQLVVQQLLTYGVALSIFEAAAIGEVEVVRYLLSEGAGVNDYSYDGWTPLHLASFFGMYDAAVCLIEHGADVNAISENSQRNRPIHAAAAGRKYPLVKLLLDHGADPNAQQAEGWTPLLLAVNNFDEEMTSLLLDSGADTEIANKAGLTPLSLAKERQFERIAQQLEDARFGKI